MSAVRKKRENLPVLTADEAGARLRQHFSETSSEQFIDGVRRFCPELAEAMSLEASDATSDSPSQCSSSREKLRLS